MRSALFALGLAAIAAASARPAPACKVVKFQIVGGLDAGGNAVVGQAVNFQVWFERPMQGSQVLRNTQIGSLKMTYGDGSVEDTGLKTFDPASGLDYGGDRWIFFYHRYAKTGTFLASLGGGSVQPCATTSAMSYRIPVVGNPTAQMSHESRRPTPEPTPHLAKANPPVAARAAIVLPTPATYENSAKTGPRGQIAGASVSYTGAGNLLYVDGTGNCGLKAFETMNGAPLKTYDYSGPLPARITLVNTQPGIHVLKVEGDKSILSCGGSAGASGAYAKK